MADSESARKVREALAAQAPEPKTLSNADFLSLGVSPLNCACTGSPFRGFRKGGIYRLIGKSRTGKTFIGNNVLCEAAISKHFDDYQLIFNPIERGSRIDLKKYFPPLVERLRAAAYEKKDGKELKDQPIVPSTLAELYETTLARLEKGKPFIELVDSLDALSDVGTDKAGMTDGRAKRNSQELRRLIGGLEDTGSIFIIVQHAKINLGVGFSEFVTTGGDSPLLYSSLDIWLGRRETLKVEYRVGGKSKEADDDGGAENTKMIVGELIEAHVVKNRETGRDRRVLFPIRHDYGIDDVDACVRYLLQFGKWTKEKGIITAPEFKFIGKHNDLIKKIEDGDLQQELRVLVGRHWQAVEDAIAPKRKPRYG